MVERIKPDRQESALLPTESGQRFRKMRREILEFLDPRNPIAKIFADDVAHDAWLAKRYQAGETSIIRQALPEALFQLLAEFGEENAGALAIGWSTGEPTATAQALSILEARGLSERDIEAKAMTLCAAQLSSARALLNATTASRDKSLVMVGPANEMSGRDPQQVAPASIEGKLVRLSDRKGARGNR